METRRPTMEFGDPAPAELIESKRPAGRTTVFLVREPLGI